MLFRSKTKLFGGADPGVVTGAELAYLNSPPEEVVEKMSPCWSIEFSTGWSVAVDAFDGSVTVTRRVGP